MSIRRRGKPMRKLSETFMACLTDGFLAGLVKYVRNDFDLDMEIRDNYINIYYKGNSLLKLAEAKPDHYRAEIDPKFLVDVDAPGFKDAPSVDRFLKDIPKIKENIIRAGHSSIETEYEQMIIRANNYEPRNNSEYFIVDRQYSAGKAGRFDLTGVYWPRVGRHKGQTVRPCLMEIKYALNQDIQNLHEQIDRYYQAINADPAGFAREAESILSQKLKLGLFNQPKNRIEAMETLKFSTDINDFQFIIILIDYNPYSSHLNLKKVAELPYASQIKIMHSGFAMWEKNLGSELI